MKTKAGSFTAYASYLGRVAPPLLIELVESLTGELLDDVIAIFTCTPQMVERMS